MVKLLLETVWWLLTKLNIELIWFSSFTFGYVLRHESRISKEYLYTYMCRDNIKVEATQVLATGISMVIYCCCLVVESCPTLRSHGLQHSRPPDPHDLLKFAQVHVHCIGYGANQSCVMPSSHLILWHPLLLPSAFPSIRDFSNDGGIYMEWNIQSQKGRNSDVFQHGWTLQILC